MANIYIFTAGTSLISNLELHPRGKPIHTRLTGWFENRTIDRILEHPEENFETYHLLGNFYQGKSGKDTTAEVASFLKLELSQDDRLVLLASDTPEGMFSALVNAHMMSHRMVEHVPSKKSPMPVCIWDDPGIPTQGVDWNRSDLSSDEPPDLLQNQCGQVSVMRITGLDPANASGFEDQAVGNLVWTISRLVKYARGRTPQLDPVIIFTGGFKVGLPVLTQAASWLEGVPMWGLHESSDQLIRIPLLASAVDERLKKAVVGWAWREARFNEVLKHFYKTATQKEILKNWAKATDMNFDELDKDIKPLFAPRGSKVTLNILGEAFLAVILTNLPPSI